jgi:cyclophilin family peptidyl-prolyl cis-trans isomerase
MANASKNTNGSQFFITLVSCSWLDNKHVVFSKVVEGKEVVDKMHGNDSGNGKPKKIMTITNCGPA